jgi:L-2-hydroxyglutarate oxidase LhgO
MSHVIVVAGGGVVGLASGIALSGRGHTVVIVERHRRPGLESSTHNSGVIHAGLYHPPQTLKTVLCHEGRARLYAFCREHAVPHVRCGKMIAGTPADDEALETLVRGAAANGVALVELDARQRRKREPAIEAARALWSADSGWVDADAYVRALQRDFERRGGVLLTGTPIVGIEARTDGGLDVVTHQERISAQSVVNAAGLYADDLSRLAGGEAFRIYPCRGEYAELAPGARDLIRGLVYPAPHPSGHGLGVHFTKTLEGAVWLGPSIRYQDDKADYERDRLPLDDFLESAREFLPTLTLKDVRLSGSGIRAKLHPPTERFADFLIRRDARVPALVHAAGIDSPGLTASLAIGERVAEIIGAP